MAIESVRCPSCGSTGIQIDTSREHSFCSYCGSTVKTKDVLHLDVESMTLEKLKRNAQKSFALGQYGNARADWVKATQLDRTDYESYWGIVCCDMATQPDSFISEAGHYGQALAYAPPDVKVEYERQVGVHNNRILEAQEAHEAKVHEAEAEFSRLSRQRKRLRFAAILFIIIIPLLIIYCIVVANRSGKSIYGMLTSDWPILETIVLSALAIAAWVWQGITAKKIRESAEKLKALNLNPDS